MFYLTVFTFEPHSHNSLLLLLVPPQITPFEFGEEILNEGETASVSCVMNKGDLPVAFKWLFNGEEIKPRNNLGIVLTTISKKTSILNIEAVNSVHRGSYTCEIRNQAGQTNHTTLLSVNGSLCDLNCSFISLFYYCSTSPNITLRVWR